MNSFLLSFAALLVLVLGILFAAPLVVDWNDYRAVFEAQASKLLGRDVSVGGDVHLVLLPAPQLSFEHVRVADETGSLDTPFLEIRSFTASLAIGPLLGGALEARKITISEPVLRLRLDREGVGNWTDVGRAGERLPFVQQTVALDEVSISDGRIELARDDAPLLALDDIDGELSARSLSGPYRFTGTYLYEGRPQELRFSTGTADPERGIRIKASLRDSEIRANYLLDGELTGLGASPSFHGAVIANLSMQAGAPAETRTGQRLPGALLSLEPETSAEQAPRGPVGVELKGELKATFDRAELPALELTIRDARRPQTLRGQLVLDLMLKPQIDARLSARWLDVDQLMTDETQTHSPLEAIAGLADLLLAEAAAWPPANLTLSLDQATLSGDLVTKVELTLATGGDAVAVERLKAQLPGETGLEASGRITPGPVFTGSLSLGGAKPQTFLRWAGGDREAGGQAMAGDFSISGDLTLARDRVAIADASGELSGTRFQGALDYAGGDRPSLALKLDSDRLDLRDILPGDFAWHSFIAPPPGEDAAVGIAPDPRVRLRAHKADIDLRIAELLLPDMPAGSLEARFSYLDDTLDVSRLDFSAGEALALRGHGKVERLSQAPAGEIDFVAKAETPDTVQVLAAIAGLSGNGSSRYLDRLAPLDLAGAMSSARGENGAQTAVRIGGTAGGADLSLNAELHGDFAEPREAKLVLDGTLMSEDPRKLLKVLFPDVSDAKLRAAGTGQGLFRVNLDGVPKAQMQTSLSLETGAARLRFDGQASMPENSFSLSGRLDASSRDTGLMLSLFGLSVPPSARDVPLSVDARLDKTGSRYGLTEFTAALGAHSVTGSGSLDLSEDKTRIAADLAADYVSLPALLGLFLDWERAPGTDMFGAIGFNHADVWPSHGFALSPLDKVEGQIKLRTQDLALSEAFQLTDAAVDLRLAPGTIELKSLQGQLFDGTLTASGDLSAVGSGARFGVKASLDSGRLEQFTEKVAGSVLADGPFSLDAELSGEGLSPPGLIAGLDGEGRLTLQPGELQTLTDAPLTGMAAEAARAKKIKADKEKVREIAGAIRDQLTEGSFAYRSVSLLFSVKNGTLRFEPATLSGDDTQIALNGYLELASLRLDSEWVMQPKTEGELPPVTLVFAGPLTRLAAISPSIDTQPIESYLTVRRMEEDVERLENLDVTGRTLPDMEEDEELKPGEQAARPQDTAAPEPQPQQIEVSPVPVPAPDRRPARAAAVTPGEVTVPTPQRAPRGPALAAPAPGEAASPPDAATAVPGATPPPSAEQPPAILQQQAAPEAFPPGELPTAAVVEEQTPVVQPRPRPRRAPRAPDDWKKGISIFGGR